MPVTIEGYTLDDVRELPTEQVDAFLFCGQPVVLRMGAARVLVELHRTADSLVVELAQIEGGGEGVLPALRRLAPVLAADRGLERVEWIVHAVYCAKPNPRLQEILERWGFTVTVLPKVGTAYYLSQPVPL